MEDNRKAVHKVDDLSRVSGFIGGIFGNFECTFEKKFFMPDKIFFGFFMYFTSKKYIHI